MCDIVWVSPQEHWLESENFHFILQAPQWPCTVWKRFRRDHCCRRRTYKPWCLQMSVRCNSSLELLALVLVHYITSADWFQLSLAHHSWTQHEVWWRVAQCSAVVISGLNWTLRQWNLATFRVSAKCLRLMWNNSCLHVCVDVCLYVSVCVCVVTVWTQSCGCSTKTSTKDLQERPIGKTLNYY